MSELRIPTLSEEQLAEYDYADLHHLLGELERARYKMADVEKSIMDELDAREDA